MNGQKKAVVAVLAILAAGTGCVGLGGRAYELAYQANPGCGTPACQRDKVYLFAVGGPHPLDWWALETLREELNRQGYAKVGTGPAIHTGWVLREMAMVRRHVPESAFVLVGVGWDAAAALRTARQAGASGCPVAAVVLIDPGPLPPLEPGDPRVLTIRAGGCGSSCLADMAEAVVVPESLPRHRLIGDPRTVAVLRDLLDTLAATMPLAAGPAPPAGDYEYAPPPRPLPAPGDAPEWHFLFDQPGRPVAPIAGTVPLPVSPRPPGIVTSR